MNAISCYCSWSHLVKFIPLVPDVLLLLLHGRLLGVEVVPRPGQNLPAGHHLSPGQSNLCLGRAGHHPPPQADQLRQGFANSVILLFTYFHFTTSISQTLKRVKVRFYDAVALLHKIHKTFGILEEKNLKTAKNLVKFHFCQSLRSKNRNLHFYWPLPSTQGCTWCFSSGQ